jgi:hypothetical protein
MVLALHVFYTAIEPKLLSFADSGSKKGRNKKTGRHGGLTQPCQIRTRLD